MTSTKQKTIRWWQWVLIGALLLITAGIVGRQQYHYYKWRQAWRNHPYHMENMILQYPISDSIAFFSLADWGAKQHPSGMLYNTHTGQVELHETLLWVRCNEDSLAVAAKAGSRFYINRFTAEKPFDNTYSHAWLFAEGVAAVADTSGMVGFITHEGQPAFEARFPFVDEMYDRGCLFHSGHCIIPTEGHRFGLIDHEGRWVVKPEWDDIQFRSFYWELRKDERLTLLDSTLATLVSVQMGTESRPLTDEGGGSPTILVERKDMPAMQFSARGKMLSDSVVITENRL